MTAQPFMRLPEVVQRTMLSKSEIYRRIADGTFPKQRKISTRKSVWVTSEIDTWVNKQIGGFAA